MRDQGRHIPIDDIDAAQELKLEMQGAHLSLQLVLDCGATYTRIGHAIRPNARKLSVISEERQGARDVAFVQRVNELPVSRHIRGIVGACRCREHPKSSDKNEDCKEPQVHFVLLDKKRSTVGIERIIRGSFELN